MVTDKSSERGIEKLLQRKMGCFFCLPPGMRIQTLQICEVVCVCVCLCVRHLDLLQKNHET